MNAKYGNVTTKILTVLLVLAMVMVARESAQFVSTLEEHARRTFHKNGEEITIVVDAGHGGIDPGKIGVNNALEKDINLAIALKLERNLRENEQRGGGDHAGADDQNIKTSEGARGKGEWELLSAQENIRADCDCGVRLHEQSRRGSAFDAGGVSRACGVGSVYGNHADAQCLIHTAPHCQHQLTKIIQNMPERTILIQSTIPYNKSNK